jgi:CheY-like chemotaxis protein
MEPPPARHDPTPAPRALIVEDEPALLRALRINLRARGYNVGTATAGREALAEARRHPPDLVLLDLGLPDLDGTEVIRELRGWSTAPVIVLSGRSGSSDKIGALDAGADDYVTKPFDMEELLARLRAALRRDRQPRATRFRIGRNDIDLTAHTIVPADGQAVSPDGRNRCISRRPNGGCWRSCSPPPASSSARAGCSARSGGPGSSAAPTTCGSTWPGCAASWKRTRTAQLTC